MRGEAGGTLQFNLKKKKKKKVEVALINHSTD